MLESLHAYLQRQPSTGVVAWTISRSLRFNSADSASLTKTFAGAGTRTTNTLSLWCKRAALGTTRALFGCGTTTSDTDYLSLAFNSSDQIIISGGTTTFRQTTRVFRDPAAWYHIVVAIDTGNGTANNRIRLYVNGSEVTAFAATNNPSSGANAGWSQAAQHMIGARGSLANYLDAYLAEILFIDGTALTPSSFGQTDATTGQWVPKSPTGLTYGTNGFYLKLADNASALSTTLGKDSSGNGNNFTPNNLSVTTGSGNDSVIDTPLNNYPTLNLLNKPSAITIVNGMLDYTATATAQRVLATQRLPSTGKWYWEFTPTSNGGNVSGGICTETAGNATYPGGDSSSWGYFGSDGKLYTNNAGTAYGSTFTTNDVIGVAFDADNGKLFFSKNGTWQNSSDPVAGTNPAVSSLTSRYVAAFGSSVSTTIACSVNFGQRSFSGSAPSGYSPICTGNLSTPSIQKPSDYFNPKLYTGTGAAQSITGVGHQPDLLWFKNRAAASHIIIDSVRGNTKEIQMDTTDESTGASRLNSFDTDGWTFGATSAATMNASTNSYVAWSWKKGVTPGFDIVTYTGTGSNTTVAHSLGVAPKFLMIKDRNGAAANNWFAWHQNLTSGAHRIIPNTTAAQDSQPTMMNSTAPTSSVFSVGTAGSTNTSGKLYVAFLWAEVAGFSKFGTYTGNGSADGPFVYCGFKPRFVMVKRTDSTENWQIYDTARDTYNVGGAQLYPDLTNAEGTGNNNIDILSNGFKLRASAVGGNTSAATYIFAAFAETPFKSATAR